MPLGRLGVLLERRQLLAPVGVDLVEPGRKADESVGPEGIQPSTGIVGIGLDCHELLAVELTKVTA